MRNGENPSINLSFLGPFKFTAGPNYLFNSTCVKKAGIYIWTIKDEKNGLNYVHYIGETGAFGKRHKEHLIQITGLNYRILDANAAKIGQTKIIWDGLWRDRSPKAVASLIEKYNEVSQSVVEYIKIINIYFAPTDFDTSTRRHIEGSVGKSFRNKHPELTCFYPNDNRLSTKGEPIGVTLKIQSPETIAGIDGEQII